MILTKGFQNKMPKYCLDTSGLSNPYANMPEAEYPTVWKSIYPLIQSNLLCWNEEIDAELQLIQGKLHSVLKNARKQCCYKIGDTTWSWQSYLNTYTTWNTKYRDYISEYNNNRANTIGKNDISIVALSKTLDLPLISMEVPVSSGAKKRLHIPDLCSKEGIRHLTFNELLIAEKITI